MASPQVIKAYCAGCIKTNKYIVMSDDIGYEGDGLKCPICKHTIFKIIPFDENDRQLIDTTK